MAPGRAEIQSIEETEIQLGAIRFDSEVRKIRVSHLDSRDVPVMESQGLRDESGLLDRLQPKTLVQYSTVRYLGTNKHCRMPRKPFLSFLARQARQAGRDHLRLSNQIL